MSRASQDVLVRPAPLYYRSRERQDLTISWVTALILQHGFVKPYNWEGLPSVFVLRTVADTKLQKYNHYYWVKDH